MLLSAETIAILKSFVQIHGALIIRKGNTLCTQNAGGTQYVFATLQEEFPFDMGIYDLARFVHTLDLFKSPELFFDKSYISIKENDEQIKRTARYPISPIDLINNKPMRKPIFIPTVSFRLYNKDFSEVRKARDVFGSPEYIFTKTENGDLYIAVTNTEDRNAGLYKIEIGKQKDNDPFFVVYKHENLRIMPMDYDVEISAAGISSFKNDTLEYYITVEEKSRFGSGKV